MEVDKRGEGSPYRLVVFDVEGVLLPKRRYLLFDVAGKLSISEFVKILLVGTLYEIGLLPLGSALGRIFEGLRGFTREDLFTLYRPIPLMVGAEEVFRKLRERGYRTALISSGLPTFLVEDLAARLRADYALGLNLQVTNGLVTGKIEGDVLKPRGKALVLERIMKREGLLPKDCVVVADDRNNLPMFPHCGLRIGYNPDFMVTVKSDYVFSGDLTEILPVITESATRAISRMPSRRDIARETIHIGSFLVPFVCKYFLDSLLVAFLIFIVTSLYIVSEFARVGGTDVPILSTITWKAATKTELFEFATAPVFFALGVMVSLTLFPAPISYVSVAVLTLGDGLATLFGKIFGGTTIPFNKRKTMEGSVFGFCFAFLGAMLFISPLEAFVGAFVGIVVELIPLPVSDNVTIPVASGLALLAIR